MRSYLKHASTDVATDSKCSNDIDFPQPLKFPFEVPLGCIISEHIGPGIVDPNVDRAERVPALIDKFVALLGI